MHLILAREAVIKSLGVMKLPGVEHLKTAPLLGDVQVLPLTLRSTAQGVNLPPNLIPLLTHHTISLFIHFSVPLPNLLWVLVAYLHENIKWRGVGGGDPNL